MHLPMIKCVLRKKRDSAPLSRAPPEMATSRALLNVLDNDMYYFVAERRTAS
jgi:hypothetical protein